METVRFKRENLTKKLVKLNGGLGNQMFQYAFAYALSKKFNIDIAFDLSWFDDVKIHQNVTPRPFELSVFNIDCEAATEKDLAKVVQSKRRSKIPRFLWKIFKIQKYKPTGNKFIQMSAFEFDKTLFNQSDYFYYEGYFQNEKYFKNVREEILNHFKLKVALDYKNQLILNKIRETNSVSIHVRRGDYVTLECAKNFHGTCSLDYYQKVIKYIAKKVKDPHFFVFSDDIAWVSDNLKTKYPCTIVDVNQDKSWLDLELMKNCKHNIIANSSFSWWGAWLNETPKKIVIAPKKWVAKNNKKCGIIPPKWIKL